MDRQELPFNAVAPVVVALAGAVMLVELLLSAAGAGLIGGAGGIGWRMSAIQDWGFSPAVLDQVARLGNASAEMLKRFVSYGFVHGSFTHALFGAAMLLALGKFVGDLFAGWAVLALYLGGLIAGAVVFGLVFDGPLPLFGAYPGVYALIGAFSYVIFARLGERGENQLRAFRLIGLLLALQLVFGLLFGGNWTWVAEIAGFVAGFALSVVLIPGGFRALRARIQSR